MSTARYFAYTRVSTVKQGEHGVSLAEQKCAIEAYASRNGLEIIRWFEEMETAATQGRRQFAAMLTALKKGSAEGLIVHKIDRSARNFRDWADIADLIDMGVDVRFVIDNLDLRSTGGRLTADLQAAIAAHYIRNLREEVKKGQSGRLKQGLYPWGAPVGYVNTGEGKVKTIDPVKGPLVRHLFERYATNTVGFEALRHELASVGLTTRAGKPLAPNSLTHILNNPFYAGVIRVSTTGETYPGVHEPLITKALFDRVQAILRGKTVPKGKNPHFLFRQMVHCADCNRRTLTGEAHKTYSYYRCHSRECAGSSWKSDVLEGIAMSNIERIRLTSGDVGDLRDVVRDIVQGDGGDRGRLRASLTLRLQSLDDRLTRLTDLLLDETIDKAAYTARREKLLMERQGITYQLQQADIPSPLETLFQEFERNNTALLQYELMNDEEKREMLDIVCSNFSVTRESSTFTLRSPYQEIAELHERDGCGHGRDKVRIRTIARILKNFAEEEISGGGAMGVDLVSRPHAPSPPNRN